MADQKRLMALSMPTPTAKEVAAQIEAQTGDVNRLMAVSIPTRLAVELAAQIDAEGTTNPRTLAEFSMVPALATEVVAQIEADRAE